LSIRVRYEDRVFKILEGMELEKGMEGTVKITSKKDVLKIAGRFSGIGGYKKKVTSSKLDELEGEIHG